jgi:hypothetical protein
MKVKLIFIGKTFFFLKNSMTKTKCHFPAPQIFNLPFENNFLQFKACKSGEIDAIGIEVAQQKKLSECPTRGHFTDKNAFLPVVAFCRTA